ncbi:ribonuclease H-like domain-containing protein [Salinigranum sp. GCM10025319]|uniref:ribonuclease H-like domain-containing protein n=1 Tax=Salinigranum sp. GCM10025319 TaxID=3252687 RepID=UPI00360C29A9
MRVENSFIPVRGVGETTERRLWRQGIREWGDFHADVDGVGPTTAERIESFIDEARPRLRDRDSAYFARTFPDGERWQLYETFRDDACFFDIETTGLDHSRDAVTTVSLHRDGETTTLVRGDDLSADALEDAFADAGLLVTFNGARFDVPFLETSFDVNLDYPHLDLMYACRSVGLTGGLKRIEREVGIGRDRPDISGRDAVRLWRQYERGDSAALDTLVSYNREDTVNLATLADHVTARLDERAFGDEATVE